MRHCLPFLRWPGGKRWLTPLIEKRIRALSVKRYFEPFLGGGAFFFHFGFQGSVLTDINPELINVYIQVRDKAEELVDHLKVFEVDAECFYRLRRTCGGSELERAARFLFLNRTAFSGMYRLNRLGQFNVPYGGGARTHHGLWTRGLLVKAAGILNGCLLESCDFEESLSRVGGEDLVYCDPTYTVTHNNNGFRRYNECNFTWRDQERLAVTCRRAAKAGATVVVSNAFHQEVAALYDDFEKIVLERITNLCPKVPSRGKTREYLFVANLPP